MSRSFELSWGYNYLEARELVREKSRDDNYGNSIHEVPEKENTGDQGYGKSVIDDFFVEGLLIEQLF